MKIKVKAYAKINLMLDIVAQRKDGYHDLFMIMQSVGLYDTVTVEKIKGKKIILLDDIFTTGATAFSCAKTLKEAGAEKIYLLTLLSAGNRHHLMIE